MNTLVFSKYTERIKNQDVQKNYKYTNKRVFHKFRYKKTALTFNTKQFTFVVFFGFHKGFKP